ncbi:MAG: lipoprotein-releasing ABC transporter permease subunit [Alphaproteobacteria bacterium]|nr:lipoprotein-releasing ABC transporter permease subunit [Alphaproteobacteria bacterium]
MALFERIVGFRYLRSRKRTGFVSVIAGFSFLGITLGVATLIIVMSVMNGFREELLSRILGINGHLGIFPAWGPTFQQDPSLISRLEKVYGVRMAMPVLEGQIMASTSATSQGVLLRGVTREDFMKRSLLMENFQGSIDDFEQPSVIVGYRLASKMGLHKGDKVNLISPNGNVTAFGTMPRMKAYKVIGTFNTGMYEYDSNLMFMPMEEAQKYLMNEGNVSQIDIFLDDISQTPSVSESIAEILPPYATVMDWQHANSAFFNAIEVERNVMFLILTLIIVVAAFNIISGLIMLVKDKGKDIAILRTMGASRKSVMCIFLIDGLSVGVVGTLLGLCLGVLFCANIETIRHWLGSLAGRDLFSAEIYFLSQLPAKVDPVEVVCVVTMALVLSFLATLYPSWKASKIDPAEALRYE